MNYISLTKRVEQLDGKKALLRMWELQSKDVQFRQKDYINGLKKRIRQYELYVKNHSLIKNV
jgi:hypothetical protein